LASHLQTPSASIWLLVESLHFETLEGRSRWAFPAAPTISFFSRLMEERLNATLFSKKRSELSGAALRIILMTDGLFAG
jgi:hypothetical protein